MSTIAQGSRRQILSVAEVSWGVAVATPAMSVVRNTGGAGIQVSRALKQSAELRSDRAISDARLGVQKATFPIPFELSWQTYDYFLESALFGTWTTDVLERGTTPKSFNLEEGFTDISVYYMMLGAMVDTFTLSMKPEGDIITGVFNFLGSQMVAPGTSSADASPSAANTNPPFDSFTGYIKKDTVALAAVTACDLQVANNLKAIYQLFSNQAYDMGAGRANVTGSVNAFFISKTHMEEFLAETEFELEFQLEDQAGNTYTITIPRAIWTDNKKNVSENEITQSMPFQALYDSVDGTDIYITRAAAI